MNSALLANVVTTPAGVTLEIECRCDSWQTYRLPAASNASPVGYNQVTFVDEGAHHRTRAPISEISTPSPSVAADDVAFAGCRPADAVVRGSADDLDPVGRIPDCSAARHVRADVVADHGVRGRAAAGNLNAIACVPADDVPGPGSRAADGVVGCTASICTRCRYCQPRCPCRCSGVVDSFDFAGRETAVVDANFVNTAIVPLLWEMNFPMVWPRPYCSGCRGLHW